MSSLKFCPHCSQMLVNKKINGEARRACPDQHCGFVHWGNPVPVVAALVQQNDHYVLAQNRQWPVNIYSVITGYLERGETVEQAVAREVNEELGLDTNELIFLGHYPYLRKNQLIIGYWVKAQGELTLNEEIAQTKLLTAAQLTQWDFGVLEVTKQLIEDWKRQSAK